MKDGHIHTPFCPHGSNDRLEEYVERAISLGFTELSFTEHAPLPDGFEDPAPLKDSAMKWEHLEDYFQEIEQIKEKYQRKIKINCGLEVDYIEGFEEETKHFLNKYGNKLDDAVLSVHFLLFDNQYDCLDYSPDVFGEMAGRYGSVENVYEIYYNTLLKSIESDLGPFKPKRIGHITLVHKFQLKYPPLHRFEDKILEVLHSIKGKGYELDYNGAGVNKPLCRETYPPEWVVKKAKSLGIPFVYGSDAHQAKELGQGLKEMPIQFINGKHNHR